MVGLAIVLVLVIACYVSVVNIAYAYEESEKKIHLQGVQSPEQLAAGEKVKEQWLSDFNRLLNKSNNEVNSSNWQLEE